MADGNFQYFDWSNAWHVCPDCNGKFRQKYRRQHYLFECGASSPVANKISIVELATQLNVHRVTVWRWVKKYKLKTIRYCGAAYISQKEYQRFLEEDGRHVAGALENEIGKAVG